MTRTLSFVLCTAAAAAAMTGCASNPNSPDVTFPVSVTLQVGQTRAAGGLNVTFLGVSDDSRCPINASCISAGDANLQFTFTANSRASAKSMQVHQDGRQTTYEGFGVEVQNLAPLPFAGQKLDQSEYRVTLEVKR